MGVGLSRDEIDTIRTVLGREFGPDVRIWLFGGRARGKTTGDYDLYAEVTTPEVLMPKERAREILESCLRRKVDLVIHQVGDEPTAFAQLARQTGVPLT